MDVMDWQVHHVPGVHHARSMTHRCRRSITYRGNSLLQTGMLAVILYYLFGVVGFVVRAPTRARTPPAPPVAAALEPTLMAAAAAAGVAAAAPRAGPLTHGPAPSARSVPRAPSPPSRPPS